MGYRRRSRELAMQALFYIDMQKEDPKEMAQLFINDFKPSRKTLDFFWKLINGVIEQKDKIDALIEQTSNNWKVSRMACIDRNIIRIGVYEILYLNDIPSKVTINEAIDIGKRYGTEDSGAFINGVLDSIRKFSEHEKEMTQQDRGLKKHEK
jgi:N utilization substance protein B